MSIDSHLCHYGDMLAEMVKAGNSDVLGTRILLKTTAMAEFWLIDLISQVRIHIHG